MTRLAIIFSLLFARPAWAETVLYCQEELATGILKKNGRWQEANFKLRRHTVKFDEKNMTLGGLIEKIEWLPDNKSSVMVNDPLICERPWATLDEIKKDRDLIKCVSRYGDHIFDFDKKTLRYSYYTPNFYSWILGGTTPDTNVMNHGTCQKF